MNYARTIRCGNVNSAILRAAVDKDDFEKQVLVDGIQDVGQAVFFIEGGDNEGGVHDKL